VIFILFLINKIKMEVYIITDSEIITEGKIYGVFDCIELARESLEYVKEEHEHAVIKIFYLNILDNGVIVN